MAAGDFCNLRRKRIGAVMAAEQGHDGGAIFGNGYDWRLGSLVGEMGGNGADEDAAGAEADDGLALLEEFGEMGGCLGVGDIAAGYAIGRVDFAVQFGLELLGERQRGDAENEDDGLHHDSLPV